MAILIIYVVIALISGYFFARDIYRGGFTDSPDAQGSVFIAFLVWIGYGAFWPFIATILGIAMFIEWNSKRDRKLGRSLGDILFGKPQS